MEADFSFRSCGRRHKPLNGIQNSKNLLVMDGKFSLQLDIANCAFKLSNSSAVNWNIKSDRNRSTLDQKDLKKSKAL